MKNKTNFNEYEDYPKTYNYDDDLIVKKKYYKPSKSKGIKQKLKNLFIPINM